MKKLILGLLFIVSMQASGQPWKDVKPADVDSFKFIQSPLFYNYLTRHTIWIYKGSSTGYTELTTEKRLKAKVDSLDSSIAGRYVNSSALGAKSDTATVGAHVRNVTTAHNINLKVDKVAGKQLSTEDYSSAEKTKLAGIENGANNYTHPANHPPSIITQDASNRFVSDAEKATWNAKQPAGSYEPANSNIQSHIASTSNPHSVTKAQVGLGNVDNVSDANKPISTATQTALNGKISTSLKGTVNGVAELDENGKVPAAQLPSFVDDVLEYNTFNSLPVTGESGKIYVTQDDGQTYRWSGSVYTVISPTIALGETSTTAYRGDRGKAAYDHSQSAHNYEPSITKGTGFLKWNGSGWVWDSSNYLTGFTELDPAFTGWNKSSGISITKSQVSDFPTQLSQFTNNLGNYGNFLTSETDPTIYAWAKASIKPSYVWTEIGSRPTALSQFTNDLGNYGNFWNTSNHPTTLGGYGILDGVTGGGASGQLAFWNGTTVLTGNNGITWDNANQKLIVAGGNSTQWNDAFGWGNWADHFGSTAGTIAQGNDSRLSDARNPTSGSSYYIQNQNGSAQSANMWISGAVKSSSNLWVKKAGSNTIGEGSYLSLEDGSTPNQAILQLNADYGLDYWFYNGSWNKRITFSNDGTISAAGGNSTQWNSAYSAINASGLTNNTLTKWDQTNSKLVNSGIIQGSNDTYTFSRSGKVILLNPNYGGSNTNADIQTDTGMDLTFSPAGNEIGRFTTSSKFLLGYPSDPTSGNKFAVNGNGYFGGTATSTGNMYAHDFAQTSDSTLKRNIKPIQKKFNFNFYQYTFKDDSTNRLRYGPLAQELEKDYPELVYTMSNGKKGVSYTNLLIAEVSKLEGEINDLKYDKYIDRCIYSGIIAFLIIANFRKNRKK